MRRELGPALAVGALVLSGCTSAQSTAAPTFSMAATPVTLTPTPCGGLPTGADPAAGGLPDLRLPCLGAGPNVDLGRLRGPAVVNVWASWCGPCVEELPVMARFAAGTSKVAVLGIDYEDVVHADAVAALSRAQARYPSVVDRQGHIGAAGVPPLPTTFFVNASGRIVFHQTLPYASLALLEADVRTHLGVAAA